MVQSFQGQRPSAYQLKITLSDSVPDIWRRFVVPADITLAQLHVIMQHTLGWEVFHDYGLHLGVGLQIDAVSTEARSAVVRADVGHQPLYYLYDFKGGWLHRLELEALDADGTDVCPVCLDGAEACPPENAGGVWGYDELMDRLDAPSDPEYMMLIEKYGSFAPAKFDVAVVNARLQKL